MIGSNAIEKTDSDWQDNWSFIGKYQPNNNMDSSGKQVVSAINESTSHVEEDDELLNRENDASFFTTKLPIKTERDREDDKHEVDEAYESTKHSNSTNTNSMVDLLSKHQHSNTSSGNEDVLPIKCVYII